MTLRMFKAKGLALYYILTVNVLADVLKRFSIVF